MAAELIGTNYAMTTVGSGGYTSGASALNVVSTSTGTGLSPFPAAGNFRVTIFNQSTGAPEVVLLVTAIASGTQFTTTAEVDGNASAGDLVLCTITSGGVGALLAQANMTGTFASLPTTVPFAGARYKCTDSPYEFISDGTNWNAYVFGRKAMLPPASGWTSVNLTSTGATVDYTYGFGYMIGNSSSNSDFLSLNYRAAPGSTPYSFTVRMQSEPSGIIETITQGGAGTINNGGFALGFSDGTKYLVLTLDYSSGNYYLIATEWNTSTSVNTSPVAVDLAPNVIFAGPGALWFRIRNDGTHLYLQISLDGNRWYTFYSQTITAFLSAATNVCWGMYGHSQSPTVMLLDWTQGT